MLRFVLVSLLSLITTFSFAQHTISSKLDYFTSIKATGNCEITLIKSSEAKFDVVIENSETNNFKWSIKEGELILDLPTPLTFKKQEEKPVAKIKLYYSELLTSLDLTSNALIRSDEDITCEEININTTTSSIVVLDIKCESVAINATSSSRVALSGSTKYLSVKATSLANVNTLNMDVVSANITSTSSAQCYVVATENIDAKATSLGEIYYKPGSKSKQMKSSSFGKIEEI